MSISAMIASAMESMTKPTLSRAVSCRWETTELLSSRRVVATILRPSIFTEPSSWMTRLSFFGSVCRGSEIVAFVRYHRCMWMFLDVASHWLKMSGWQLLGWSWSVVVDMPRVGNGNWRLNWFSLPEDDWQTHPVVRPAQWVVVVVQPVQCSWLWDNSHGSLLGNVDSVIAMTSIITIIHVASMGLEERRQNGMGFHVRNSCENHLFLGWGIVWACVHAVQAKCSFSPLSHSKDTQRMYPSV